MSSVLRPEPKARRRLALWKGSAGSEKDRGGHAPDAGYPQSSADAYR